jgi:chromosome segregation ATPase
MASSLWQRLTPFLDVIGAVLIFGSWIASNALSQHALHQADIHQAIVDRVRQFRLYDDFAHRISDIQSDLARTRNLAENATARSSENGSEAFVDTPSWTGMTATQIRELNDFVEALERYAGGLSVSEDIYQSIEKARRGVHEMSKAFRSARDEYDRFVTELDTATSASTSSAVAMKELRQRIDHLWQEYDEAKENMLRVGDDLLRNAASKSEEANQVAARFKQLSYALYIIGTMIILFGRAKNALSAKKGRAHVEEDSS